MFETNSHSYSTADSKRIAVLEKLNEKWEFQTQNQDASTSFKLEMAELDSWAKEIKVSEEQLVNILSGFKNDGFISKLKIDRGSGIYVSYPYD